MGKLVIFIEKWKDSVGIPVSEITKIFALFEDCNLNLNKAEPLYELHKLNRDNGDIALFIERLESEETD